VTWSLNVSNIMANQVTLFRTEKEKEGLGYMGHVYRFGKRGLGGNIYWRCLLRDDCKGAWHTGRATDV
jgi:hypothetical protein